MTRVLEFFGSIKLTLTQWAVASLALVVGALVVRLRIQGSRLHKTQVELLKAKFASKAAQNSTDVMKAGKAFGDAYTAYQQAKKELK